MLLLIGIAIGIMLVALFCRWGMRVAMRSAFRGMLMWAFLALLVCLIPASRPAQASVLSFFTNALPKGFVGVARIGTDGAETVTGFIATGATKIHAGAAKVDEVSDEYVEGKAQVQAKAARKAAKKAAKAQKK